MAYIGYLRVSTEDQNLARQYEDIRKTGLEFAKVFEEKVSGKSIEGREQLKALMAYVREGDIVVVESFSRLARSTKDFLFIVDSLKSKGVALKSLKENFDTSTPQGEFTMTMFAALAQLERETIKQRQAEGIAVAKANGVYKGRKALDYPDDWKEVYRLWKKGDMKGTTAQRSLGLTHASFYRMVKRYEEENS